MMKSRLVLFPFIAAIVLVVFSYVFTTYGFCDETDLEIDVESITQREYAGQAVTDGYDIEILTEDGYAQAEEIAAMREKNYEMTQTALFSDSEFSGADEVAVITEKLGMFDSGYTAADIQESTYSGSKNTILIILVLLLATGGGVALAFMWQRHRRVSTS